MLARLGDADALVISADTVVVRDSEVLEKPADTAAAVAMLRSLAGRRHRVLTAVSLFRTRRRRLSFVRPSVTAAIFANEKRKKRVYLFCFILGLLRAQAAGERRTSSSAPTSSSETWTTR